MKLHILRNCFSIGTVCLLSISLLTIPSSKIVAADSSPLTFKKYADHVSIVACEKEAASVTIPQTYDNLPVTEIEGKAFYGCLRLSSIHIPDSITTIQYLAFGCCTQLRTITGGKNVTYVGGRSAVELTPWLEENQEAGEYSIIGSVLLDGSFYDKSDFTVPDNLTRIASDALFPNDYIKRICVPKRITHVDAAAFDCVQKLEAIAFLNPTCEFKYDALFGTVSNGQGSYVGAHYYNGTILGYANSTASILAHYEKYPFRQFGDCDGDDTVNANDASIILKTYADQLAGNSPFLSSTMQLAADVDHNGAINELDAVILLKYNAYQLLGERVSLYSLVP